MRMRNPGCGNNSWRINLAADAGAEIVSGKAQFAHVRRQAFALLRSVLDRVRCSKGLRAEQQKG